MAERFSWVSCIYFTKFKRRRASGFSLYTYIFVYFYAYILKKICELFTYFFICTPLNIHSYIFSFKCYTIIRVVAIFPQSWLPAAGLRKIQQITRHDPAYFYELTAPA